MENRVFYGGRMLRVLEWKIKNPHLIRGRSFDIISEGRGFLQISEGNPSGPAVAGPPSLTKGKDFL